MKVSELMKKNSLVFESDETVSHAAAALVKKGQACAPVVRGGKYLGMITLSDIASTLVKNGFFGASQQDGKGAQKDAVFKHMRASNASLKEDDGMPKALFFLSQHNLPILPVTDRRGALLGVINSSELGEEIVQMVSSKHSAKGAKDEQDKKVKEEIGGETAVDDIVRYVQKRGVATSEEVARACKLTQDEVEEYATSLERDGLLKIEYTIFGVMKLCKPE
jgi:CBS domain-containing protein